MTHSKFLFQVVAAAAIAFAASNAGAVVVTSYTSESALATAAGALNNFGFTHLTPSSSATYTSIDYDDVNFAPSASAVLKALDGNASYGTTVNYLSASVPKDTSTSGTGKADQLDVTLLKNNITAIGFELGTETLSSDKNISVVVDYEKISNGATGSKSFAPMFSSPTPGEYFMGFTVAPGYEISSVDIEENGTRAVGTALDILSMYTNGALPEPASWAMMLIGAGLTGAALRRRGLRTA